MSYKYETHFHTAESSRCGQTPAVEAVRHFKERGYDGLFITDHIIGYCSSFATPEMSWEEKVACQAEGYLCAKAEGDRIGLKVFFGIEAAFYGTCHILTYNLSIEWLLKHPEIMEKSFSEYCDFVHEAGGFVVQAHPFRYRDDEIHLLLPQMDAIEGVNGCNDEMANELSIAYARLAEKPMVAGSDMHDISQIQRNGIETQKPLDSALDYLNVIKSGEFKIFGEEL